MKNRSISELELATSVNDEDILLISQKENNQYVSRKIGAGVFKGASAYELAVNNGFNGTLNDWLSSIKGWQPITSGEFVDLLNKELDKSTLYLDIQNKLEAFVTNNTGNLLNNTVFSGTTDKWSAGTVTNQAFFNTTVPVHTITTTGDVLALSDKFIVDPSKAYEVSVWFKADSAVGSLFFGLHAFDKNGVNIGLNNIIRVTGANNTTADKNFYFQYVSGGAGLPLDWVKWVGYIMPTGTTSTDMKGIGSTTSNARMLPNTAQMQVRWLNYYNGGTSTTKWAANFKCVEVDPNSIIAGVGAKYIADSKAEVFTSTPTTPYSVGDIWKNGTTVYICTVAKGSGATYSVSDWIKSGDVTSENTSKDVVSVNGVAAATVATNAQAGKTLSDNVMSDLVITPVEKSALLTEWNRIKAEYTSIVAQATALSVDKTALTTAYTALDTTSPKIAAEILTNMTTNYVLTTATRDSFKAQLNTYFVQATAVTKAITDKVNNLLGTAQNTANSKTKTFTSTPTVPYSAGDIWRNGNTIYVSSVTRATGSYTAADWTKASDVTSENTSANTSNVGSASAASVATLVSEISNDSKLTAAEKRALNAEWERIKNTYPALITQAVNLGAIYTRTAYDALAAYIPSLALTSQTTTDIVATTFRTNFSNYYVEEATILKNIQDKQRTNVAAAIITAATDATNKADAVRDAIPEVILAQGSYADANALVTVNGVNQTYTAATGVLVMVLNQLTGVVETKTIYTADPTGFSSMKTAITALAAGKIVVMVSRQNIPMTTDTNFRDTLRLIGATDVIYNQYTRKTNNTFAIIGTKGGTAGSANESIVSVNDNMSLAYASTSATLIAGKLITDSTSYIDGALILTDSIHANSIKAGSITAAQIAGGTITADKLAIGTPNNLVSNFSKTNSGTGWINYTGIQSYTSFDGTNTPCMEIHTQHSIEVESDRFKIDPSKSYEFSVWLYSSGGNTTGRDYIGMHTFASNGEGIAATAFDVNNPNSNWDEGNPYFWHRGHGENYRDKWVKYTGYVLAAGTDLSSIKGVLGQNIDRCFRLKSNTDSMLFRILNYYNDGTTVNKLYMAHPSVKEVDTNSLIETVNNKKATSNLYYPGTTQIDGGKIQTGSITADRIQIGSLSRDRLDSSLGNKVDTAYSTANSANNKIDNLQVGGRNLVIPDFDKYSSSQTGFLVCIPQPYDIKNDITYTLSFTVEGTESVTTMDVGFAAKYKAEPFGDFWNPDNSVGKKVWTGKLSSRYSKSFFYIWINSPCTIRDIQLEEGDKATSYQKNTDYRGMRSLISDRLNDKLQNKWAYIAYKKPQSSANEMMHYGYLEGDIVSQGYVNVGNTMFSDIKFDNTYIIFRTIVTPNSVVNSGLFNFIGDDAHSIYVNGQMLYSSTLYKGGGNIPFKLFSGANNVIDILISNGYGGAGFSTTTALQDLGKMYAPSLTAVELETNSKLINDILSDNVITTDEKQSLLITYKQIASEFDTWRGEAEALGINVSEQISATNKLLSNSRPYLGWVCRNDSISSSDTLNDGERTTLMNALSDYYVSNKTITKLVTEKLRGAKTKADNVTTAIKNSSNWDGVSDTLTISRNNISGGKDLANLWTNQLFDPAFPSILDCINEGKIDHTQGSNLIRLNARHCIGDWSTRFYVKPGEQYIISCIGYNYSGVGFYTGLWITDDNGGGSTYPGYHGFVPLVEVGSTGGGWKFYEAIFTVPVGYDASTTLAARAHFFQDTFDFSVVHCKIANLAIKKVIKESGIDPQLVDRSKQAKQLVDDIVSDNKITPDEKQTLLVTYKQISNDNDIWRNQAYLIGLDYTRQWNATTTLTSTNRPYLGWVCRSDALNQTDTLNAGERTTLMNAIAEYHAANQDLAQRVGSKLRTNIDYVSGKADSATGIAAGARDLLNRWKANGNGTLYIDDNSIAVKQIGADQIAAGAITTDKLYVGDVTNYWGNQYFDPNIKPYFGTNAGGCAKGLAVAIYDTKDYYDWNSKFPVTKGDSFRFELTAYRDSGVGEISIGFHLYDVNKNWNGQVNSSITWYTDPGNGWDRYYAMVTIPDSGAYAYAMPRISSTAAGQWRIGDLVINKRVTGTLIVDGSITGDKIKANTSISAPNIIGGSIKIGSISGSSDESGNTTDATRGTMFKVNADGGFRLVSRDSSGGIELSSYSRALTVWEGDVIRVKVGKLS